MKKLLSAFALTLALFTFASCGDPTGENNNDDNENKDTYLVTEDTEFAPGWYKYTEGNSTQYYYFDETELITRAGDETAENTEWSTTITAIDGETLEEITITYNWTYVKKYLKEALDQSVEFTFKKITEDDLPVWAMTLVFEAGWYKYTTDTFFDYYLYFNNSDQVFSRCGNSTHEYTDDELAITIGQNQDLTWDYLTRQYLLGENTFIKITESELPSSWTENNSEE